MRNFIHLCSLIDILLSSRSSDSSLSEIMEPDDAPFAFSAFALEGLTISEMFETPSVTPLAPITTTTTTTTTLPPPISIDELLQAQRFDEAIELVTPNLIQRSMTHIFTEAERNRIMDIFKAAIDHERATHRDITRAMSTSRSRALSGDNPDSRLAEYSDSVLRDIAGRSIYRYCMVLIQIFSNQLEGMRHDSYAVHRANLQAIMGDLYRYISEVTHGDDKRSAQEFGLSLYADALHVYYYIGVPVDDPERLRVQTNRELLLYSVPSLRRDAIESLEVTIRELEREFNRRRVGAVTREEWDFVSLLRARLQMWKNQLQDDEWIVI